jgi:hypothetical protein
MAVAVVTISAADWLSLGLEIVGFCPRRQNVCLKTKLERFRAHFGVSPETHQAIYVDLQTTEIATARIPAPDAFYFLMAFHWLKVYPTEAQSSAIFKCDDKTVRGEVWKYVRAIQALKGQKVRAERTFAEMIIDSSLFHFLHLWSLQFYSF